MKRIARPSLTKHTLEFLAKRCARVAAAPDPAEEASRLWDLRQNDAFSEIRMQLEKMATGLCRCMYCEDSESTDIEHFWPKRAYPKRAFLWENYLYACSHCNSNQKREEFPLDEEGNPLLIDPSDPLDDPAQHLELEPDTGAYHALSDKGDMSIDIFGLNIRGNLVKGRQSAWNGLQAQLIVYGMASCEGDHIRREQVQRDVRRGSALPLDGTSCL